MTNDQKQETKPGAHISPARRARQVDTAQKQTTTQSYVSDTDTLTVNKKAAVFFQPDSQQMVKRMKEVGESEFRAGADDYIYYINTSAEYLEKQGLPVIDAKNKRYLKFVLSENKMHLVKLDTLPELWGMYLFDPKKQPYYTDITLIEEEYKSYFK